MSATKISNNFLNLDSTPTSGSTNPITSAGVFTSIATTQKALTLTTSGASGSAVLTTASTINIPTYTLAGLGGIGLSALSATSPLSYNNGTGAFTIQSASTSQSGYLLSTDWNTFNNKQTAITLTITGSSGGATLNSGFLNVPTYTLAGLGGQSALTITTSGNSGSATFNSPYLNIPTHTLAGLGGIGLTALTATSPLSYNNSTGAFTIQSANTSQSGYLVSTDWNTFNNKQSQLNGTGYTKFNGTSVIYNTTIPNNDLTNSSVTIQGSSVSLGNSLNIINGTGFVKSVGTTISYDNTTYQTALTITTSGSSGSANFNSPFLNIPTYTLAGLGGQAAITLTTSGLTGAATLNSGFLNIPQYTGSTITLTATGGASGTSTNSITPTIALTLSNSAILSQLLYGFTSSTGSVTSGDTILSSIGKLTGNLNLLTGAVVYQGTWNASTNTPPLSGGTGTKGYLYKVSVSGTTSIDGINQWNIGDSIVFDGTTWDKIDGVANEVIAFNGRTGAITLSSSDVTTALTFTPYNATNPSNYISLAALSATSPLSYNNSTGVFTIQVANTSQAGYLSQTDWNTFNNKQATVNLTTSGASGSATLNSGYLNIPTYTLSGLGGQAALVVTTTGNTGSSTFNSPYLNIPTHTLAGLGGQPLITFTTSGNSGSAVLTTASTMNIPTYTLAGLGGQGALTLTTSGASGSAVLTTANTINIPTYTLAGLGGISLTSLSATSPLSYNNTTGLFTIQSANTSQSGYLVSTDWNTFNNKQPQLSGTGYTKFSGTSVVYINTIPNNDLTNSSVTIQGSSVSLGNSLNIINGTGFVKAAGTTISYDNSTYQVALVVTTTGNTGSSTFSSPYLNIPTHTLAGLGGQPLITLTTSGSSGSAVLTTASTMNIPTYTLAGLGGISLTSLSAGSPLSYNNSTGVFSIQSANTSQSGYLVSTDWNTFNNKQPQLNGTGFVKAVGTTISYDNSTYQTAITLTTSGASGASTLNSGFLNVPTYTLSGLGGQAAIILTTSGNSGSAAFNSPYINIPTYTLAGLGGISLSSLSATSPLSYNNGTGAFTIQSASTSQSGYLVSTDWNTFNNKQAALNGTGYTKFSGTSVTYNTTIPNNDLANSSVTIQGSSVSLGGSLNVINGTGFVKAAGTTISYDNSTYQTALTLTTSGTSGAATLNSGYLNIPQYTDNVFANPTATIGLTAVNGSATTIMRSDGAPALSQAIIPTWTGIHTFSVTNTASATATTNVGTLISHIVNQSATANFTDLLINRTNTSPGSGNQYLLDLQVTGNSRVNVTTGGYLTALGGASFGPTIFQFFNQQNTLVDAVYIWNTASSTSSKPVAPSGSLRFEGSVWNTTPTAAANYFSYINYATGVSGATPTSTLVWAGSLNNSFSSPSYSNLMTLDTFGNLILSGRLTATGVTITSTPVTSTVGNYSYLTINSSTGVIEEVSVSNTTGGTSSLTLTTSGSSGSSTLNSGFLNVPTYTLAGLGGIGLTALTATSPLSYNNTTGVFTIQSANTSQSGYLLSTDWNTFNNKQTAITLTTSGTSGAATLTSGFLNIPQYTDNVFANPTATIGLTAVNGVATTIMSSDSAPALSQAITPVWTSAHTWYVGQNTGSTPVDAIVLSNNNLATSATTTQNSPSLTFSGSSWNGSSAITYNFKLKSVAVGGNGYGQFIIQGSTGNGSLSNWLIIDSFGAFIIRNNFTAQINSIGKTSADSFVFQNTSTATAGIPVQYSGRMRMQGAGWNTTTGATNQVEMIQEIRPVSGATVSGGYYWASRISSGGSGSFIDVMSVSTSGVLSIINTPTQSTVNNYDAITRNRTTGAIEYLSGGTDIFAYRAINAATTVLASDNVINVSANTFTQLLPTTTLLTGQVVRFANSGAGTLTLSATSIMGATSKTVNSGTSLAVLYTGVSGTYVTI